MGYEELMKRIEALFPVINHSQAPGIGAIYFTFKGDVLKKVAAACFLHKNVTRPTANINVHINENREIYYRVHIRNPVDFIECLEKECCTNQKESSNIV